MKRILSLILAICAAFSVCAVSGCQKSSEDVIRESIVDRFEPYKSMNEEIINRLSKTAEDEGLPELGLSGTDFAYAILDGFDYSIDNIEVSGNKATADITISSKSLTDLLESLKSTNAKLSSSSSQAQEYKTDQIIEAITQAIKDTKNSNETITLEFTLNGTEWTATNSTEELGKLDSAVFAG